MKVSKINDNLGQEYLENKELVDITEETKEFFCLLQE